MTIDRTNPANQPPSLAEVNRYYNLEAAKVWREDGYYIDWSLIPLVPVRVLEWDRVFWNTVDPKKCIWCGDPMDSRDPEDECLECRWTPFGTEWQREQQSRGEERWVRTHPLG